MVRDLQWTIADQYEALLRKFEGKIQEQDISLEMECRFKGAGSPENIRQVISILDSLPGVTKSLSRTSDRSFSLPPQKSIQMTLRETTRRQETAGEEESSPSYIVKVPVYIHQTSDLFAALEEFRSYGMKLSFAFEIQSAAMTEDLRAKVTEQTRSILRVKDRETFVDPRNRYAWEITQVLETDRFGKTRTDTELEIDRSVKVEGFLNNDPMAQMEEFVSFVEEQSRLTVFRSRQLLSEQTLKMAISSLNESLGSKRPREDYIENLVPQVKNLQIEHLLKSEYQGYAPTPKADGSRYFMMITKQHIILLQRPNTYQVLYEGPNIPEEWVGFVFDGEKIDKEHWKTENLTPKFSQLVDNYFCIFDVVAFPPDEANFPSSDTMDILTRINRLKKFFDDVRLNRRGGIFSWSDNLNSFSFLPRPTSRLGNAKKTFFEVKPYDDATNAPWAASGAFFDTLRPKLRYQDDGLIFTPIRQTYMQLRKNLCLKWKSKDMLSIDFRYSMDGLKVTEVNVEKPFQGTSLFPAPSEVIIHNPQNIPLREDFIYEFVYEPEKRHYRLTRPRFDKQFPNTYEVACQVWNDVHMPISEDLLKGEGSHGLRERAKESLWTWLRDMVVEYSPKVIVDLSAIDNLRDLPFRFLEVDYPRLMQGVKFVSVGKGGNTLEDVLKSYPTIDLVIIDGSLAEYLEGRPDLVLRNPPPRQTFDLLHQIVARSERVFIHRLPAIVRGESPSNFVTERHAAGNNEEMVIRYVDQDSLAIEFPLSGGLFRDFTSPDHPEGVPRVVARRREFPTGSVVVSTGNRVQKLRDQGPENILSGKHFGIIWQYMFNVLTDKTYFTSTALQPLVPLTSPENFLDTMVMEMDRLRVAEPREKTIVEEEEEEDDDHNEEDEKEEEEEKSKQDEWPKNLKLNLDEILETKPASEAFIANARLMREMEVEPLTGDVFDMVSKALGLLDSLSGGGSYDLELVKARAAQLRLMFGKLPGHEIQRTILQNLGLGVMFLRRVSEAKPDLLPCFRTTCPDLAWGVPKYGFLLMESSQKSPLDHLEVALMRYADNHLVIHPSDPIVKALFEQPARILFLQKRGTVIVRTLLKKRRWIRDKVGLQSGFMLTDLGAPMMFESLAVGHALTKFTASLKRKFKTEIANIADHTVFEEARKGKREFVDDLSGTEDLILLDNVREDNLIGRVLMTYRDKLRQQQQRLT